MQEHGDTYRGLQKMPGPASCDLGHLELWPSVWSFFKRCPFLESFASFFLKWGWRTPREGKLLSSSALGSVGSVQRPHSISWPLQENIHATHTLVLNLSAISLPNEGENRPHGLVQSKAQGRKIFKTLPWLWARPALHDLLRLIFKEKGLNHQLASAYLSFLWQQPPEAGIWPQGHFNCSPVTD